MAEAPANETPAVNPDQAKEETDPKPSSSKKSKRSSRRSPSPKGGLSRSTSAKSAASKSGRSTSASKKPAKKKKLSKKERARLRKEKAEQERLEQERREAEERDRIEREYEQKKREEQQQRLFEEDQEMKRLRSQRLENGRKVKAAKAQEEDWEIFKACDHFIDVRSQADVNAFITNWRESEQTELPDLFEYIHSSELILKQLTTMLQAAEVARDESTFERCDRQIKELRKLVYDKIEGITMHHLVFSDKYAGAKNEVQVSSQTDGLTFAMWVNLSKNPRIKDIEFPGLQMEISKGIAMSSLAIRVLISSNKPYNDQYLFLNKLIQCELLQLPTPPKRIGPMTLRQSPHLSTLVTLSYPLKNVQNAQPPLNFKFTVEEGFLTDYMQDATVVMLNSDNTISTQHISKVVVDRETNEISFSSMAVGTFAFGIPRFSHFPLKFWEITSLSETSIEIYLQTQLLEMAIVINGDGRCSMESPFQFENLTPTAAIEYMSERGVNIVAPPGAIEGINAKSPELEEVLAQGIADTVTGYHVKWSKWNALLPSDRAMLLMKPQRSFVIEEEEEETPEAPPEGEQPPPEQPPEGEGGEEEEGEKPIVIKRKMCCILAKANHITEVANTENEEECNVKPIDDAQIHQHLLPMFFERTPEDIRRRVREAPSFLCDATYYILKNLRLFSMTQ